MTELLILPPASLSTMKNPQLTQSEPGFIQDLMLPCHGEDPELWFADSPRDLERAKALCFQCPLRKECLQGALERQEPWGVWGGEIFDNGEVIAQKRPRGRPRKV